VLGNSRGPETLAELRQRASAATSGRPWRPVTSSWSRCRLRLDLFLAAAAGVTRADHDLGVPALQPGCPMTGAAMAMVIGVSWACVGDLFGVGDYGDLADEGVFHGGAEEEVGDVRA
jgi:hypothetical protein